MKLSEFLEMCGVNNINVEILNITGEEALAAVKQNGDALKYVKEQTEAVALAAVKQNNYALMYVDKSIFELEEAA